MTISRPNRKTLSTSVSPSRYTPLMASPLCCPSCGYTLEPFGTIDRATRVVTRRWFECYGCNSAWQPQPQLTLEGVGPEKLVRVQVQA